MTEKELLLARAERFRRLAEQVMDDRAERALLELAEEYEKRAASLLEQDSPVWPSA